MENTKKKLPFGFYVCCLTFSFERLAYYAAKWGLAIFIAAKAVNGGLGLDKSVGAAMSSNLVASHLCSVDISLTVGLVLVSLFLLVRSLWVLVICVHGEQQRLTASQCYGQ